MTVCKCGCGFDIIPKEYHKRYGTPDYIQGHNYSGFSKELKEKIKLNLRPMVHHSEISKAKMRQSHLGKKCGPHTEQTKIKIGLANHKALLGKKQSYASNEKRKDYWKSLSSEEKMKIIGPAMSASRPTKLEIKFFEILERIRPGEFRYVGDGKVWIAGKNPDFIHKSKNQVIEVFGNYWHKPEDESQRISHFINHEFDCLVVWEKDLKNPQVTNKLKEF